MNKTYITWHYTTHGVAYLKHILSCFYQKENDLPKNFHFEDLNQMELNTIFDNAKDQDGFVFDKVIYLITQQESFDKLSSRRFSYKKNIVHDDTIKIQGLSDIYDEITSNDDLCYNLSKELLFVKEKYPDKLDAFKKSIWRNIQHYPILEQLKWLKEYSNFNNIYKDKLEIVELDINDLRNEKLIANKVNAWLKKDHKKLQKSENIINVSLGSNETQVVWHILSQANQLPSNTRFIKTYDDKSDKKEKRFKPFSIKEIPINLITNIGEDFNLYSDTKSNPRKLVNKKMKVFLESGFSILLLGERGIGKSDIASKASQTLKHKGKLIQANCASFNDDDNKAESELFGYDKGAFTGGLPGGKEGLIEEANNGILFLDEVHHLPILVQAKLMKALQTDEHNKMSIRKMGDSKEIKVVCRLIFATNKTIQELRTLLLPDFYDRIVQHVVNIPPLRETKEDRMKDWSNVWKNLRLPGKPQPPDDEKLNQWIKTLPLYGNYRDLQKIAMYYNAFSNFDDETKTMLNEKTPFYYTKQEFTKYHTIVTELKDDKYNFNTNQTTKEMQADYLFELQKWAVEKFGGRNKAIEHFKLLKDTVTENTFNKWKNKYSLKK
ncbi:sigma 54-interacting transcriptional regulator [Algibacter pectinivorans]|uniref:Sigma-54 interaction domain-containing protein n=1 Tax=Algibacter pectinivorans TaxID=870482 RepID=A0A1I1R2D2_9FLAO|nr:sigma 54-interacting transcriptional regulator [Algibacter pectinivorans]SFD28367.1 Sigma-54 interaction domain-containing protein [Algibacter pectinivorans]